jgi:hypothetical protein
MPVLRISYSGEIKTAIQEAGEGKIVIIMAEEFVSNLNRGERKMPPTEMTYSHGPPRAHEVNDLDCGRISVPIGYETNCLVD